MQARFSRENQPRQGQTHAAPGGGRSGGLCAADSPIALLQRGMGNHAVARLAVDGQLPVTALAALGNRAIQRYFELPTSTHAGLGVRAAEGTRFPGHEEDVEHPDFLSPDLSVNRRELADVPNLAISDDGRMAIESAAVNGNREVEAFFAETGVVSDGNAALERVKSTLNLKQVGGQSVEVPDLRGTTRHRLGKVIAQQAPAPRREGEEGPEEVPETPSGPNLLAPEQCVAIAQAIIGQSGLVLKIADADVGLYSENDMRERMLQFLAGYLEAASKDSAEARPGKQAAYLEAAKAKASTKIPYVVAKKTITERLFTLNVYGADRENVEAGLKQLKEDNLLIVKEDPMGTDWTWTGGWLGYAKYSKKFRVTFQREPGDDFVRTNVNERLNGKLLQFTVETREREGGVDPQRTGENIDRAMKAVLDEVQRTPALMVEANRRLGMNEYAQPAVGEAYMIIHKGAKTEDQNFPYHFAAVVARSGEDSVTLENYARSTHENQSGSSNRMYFQLYGPKREVAVAEGQVRARRGEGTAAEQEAREYAAGSFHGRWAGLFSSPTTVTVKKGS